MALSESQKANLRDLDLMEGTGIFANNTRVKSVDCPVVVIGLGGLGSRTVNELKRQIKKRVDKEENSIRLLAIDSANSDLDDLKNLSKDEKISLYDAAIPSMIATQAAIPEYIKQWLNPDCSLTGIGGEGCGQIRQRGRFVLSVPPVYKKLRQRITNVILSAKDAAPMGKIAVFFIAGISGGTGSGTFIDMAYLTQDILQTEIGLPTRHDYKMSAYIYLPDVQFNCGAQREALQRNGYAALKELDYFYNLEKVNGVYQWPFVEGHAKDKNHNIYDLCTLVSSIASGGVIGKEGETMAVNVTVESLLSIITDAELQKGDGSPEQIMTSYFDNNEAAIDTWLMSPLASDTNQFPRSSNYCYNIIGYGTAKIPVDAIMSYIALNMYTNLLDEFHNMNDLTDNYINKIMNASGLGDVYQLINAVKGRAQCSYNPAQLPDYKDIRHVNDLYRGWRDGAHHFYATAKNAPQMMKAINSVAIDIQKRLESQLNAAFDAKGPYFVVNAITATGSSHGVEGIRRRLDRLVNQLTDEYNNRVNRCKSVDQLFGAIDGQAANVAKGEEGNFIRMAKNTIEMFTVDMFIITQMIERVRGIAVALVEENNKVFDVYTEVLDYIKNVLSKNSDLVVDTKKTKGRDGGVTYSLDVVNLDAEQEKGKKLKACLDSFLTPDFLNKFSEAFRALIRDPNNRPAFTDSTEKFDATLLIQELFENLLGQFYNEAVERFLIAYYSPSKDMDKISKLDAVMANPEEKKANLEIAANAICRALQHSAKPLCGIIGGAIEVFTPAKRYMCCPEVLYDIFRSKAEPYFPGISVCKRENAFSIDVVTSHIGIPLSRVFGMNEADIAYDHAVEGNFAGLHIDESAASDFRELPAPFSYETWKMVQGEHKSKLEIGNIKRVSDIVDTLQSWNLLTDKTVGSSTKLYVRNVFTTPIDREILEKFITSVNESVTQETDAAEFIADFLVTQGIRPEDKEVSIDEAGLPSTLANAKLIVRKNMVLYRQLKKFVVEYKKLYPVVIDRIKKLGDADRGAIEFERNITDFANYIRAEFIKFNPKFKRWDYTDGKLEKPLYLYGTAQPFEKTYNAYFAYIAFITKISSDVREYLNSLVEEMMQAGEIMFDMPEELEKAVNKLFTAESGDYALNRELNRKGVNQKSKMYEDAFSIPLPAHNDNYDVLINFYNTLKVNFE